jgi:hypothetical protein
MSRLINFIDYLLTRGAASVEDQAAVESQPNSIRSRFAPWVRAQAIPKGNSWRRRALGRVRNWVVRSPCTDKDSNHRGLMRWRQRLTGRLAANGKRRETDLQIGPVRVGFWG